MNTDGNTDAINRHLDEREEHDAWQEGLDAIKALADAEERIEELEAKLAEVTEERDALRMQSTDLINDTVSTGMARDEALNQLDSERYSVEVLERRIRELLPRAYRLGLDAGARLADDRRATDAQVKAALTALVDDEDVGNWSQYKWDKARAALAAAKE